jgi:hypothetical protein
MSKFITPVSMQVTKEQYENDLKQPLLDLGYNTGWSESLLYKNDNYYIICENGNYGFWSHDGIDTFFIENYNPQLFLALAAMRDGDNFHVGEYIWIIKKRSTASKKYDGCLKRVRKPSTHSLQIDGDDYGLHNDECRKATKEELIEYFSREKFYVVGIDPAMKENLEVLKEVEKNMKDALCVESKPFTLPKKWCVKVTEENQKIIAKWRNFSNVTTSIDYYVRNDKWSEPTKDKNYTEITFEQFKKHVLNMKKERFPFSLKPQDAQKIIDIACSGWKKKLAIEYKWAENIVLGNSTKISEGFYKKMRKACTPDQNALFDEIFGEDITECKFKVGDYVAHENNTFYITRITNKEVIIRPVVNNLHDHNKPYNNMEMMFQECRDDIENFNKHAKLWSLKHTKEGEAIFLDVGLKVCLRYCDGKGGIYTNNKKSGKLINATTTNIRPFDMLNLPVNE